ncbi:MAG: hypothetical protein M3O87_01810 [Candidatus Dormibacteraeota bacterium]|nr:hypothetical protein [Candidatus Dormibacteraeota bacterium]
MPDDGLPLPTLPKKVPRIPKPGANDLDTGMVRDQFNQIASGSNDATSKWADKVADAAAKGGRLKVPSFNGDKAGLLTAPDSELDKAMGVDPRHTGVKDIIKSVGAGMGYMFSHPWTSFADPRAIDKIKAAQKQFLDEYSGTLTRMSEELGDVTRTFREIGDLMDKANFSRGKLEQLMKDKEACGADVYARINRDLDAATDPDQRAELQRQKADMEAWFKECDARIAREKPTVDGLGQRIDAMQNEMARQRQVIEDARWSRGPGNMTTTGGRIIESSHLSPESVDYARGLRDVLAGSRAGLDKAMNGG